MKKGRSPARIGGGSASPSSVRRAIFLDEIGDMPRVLQGKILRVLQQHELAVSMPSEPIWLEADPVRLAPIRRTAENSGRGGAAPSVYWDRSLP